MSKVCLFSHEFRRPVNLTDADADFTEHPYGLEIPDDGQIILIELDFLLHKVGDRQDFEDWIQETKRPVLVFGFLPQRPGDIHEDWYYRQEDTVTDGYIDAIIEAASEQTRVQSSGIRELANYGIEWLEQLLPQFKPNGIADGSLTRLDARVLHLRNTLALVDLDRSPGISEPFRGLLAQVIPWLEALGAGPASASAEDVAARMPAETLAAIEAAPWAALAVVVFQSGSAETRFEPGASEIRLTAPGTMAFPDALLNRHGFVTGESLLGALRSLVTSFDRSGSLVVSDSGTELVL